MEHIISTFTIDWISVFIQVGNMVLVTGVSWVVLHRPVLRIIEHRRAQIIRGVAEAERAATILKDAHAKKAEIITAATLEAQRILPQGVEKTNTVQSTSVDSTA